MSTMLFTPAKPVMPLTIPILLSLAAIPLAYGVDASRSGSSVGRTRPDIIVILVDDWGYADLGIHGQVRDIRTPNLDHLARSGVRFSQGYVTAPQCSPSRAGILTGRYQQRFGFDSIAEGPLPLGERTVAEVLQGVGYHTGMVGKWHLSPNEGTQEWARKNLAGWKEGEPVRPSEEDRQPYEPGARGFTDYFVGEMQSYAANFGLGGERFPEGVRRLEIPGNRIEIQTRAALAFLANVRDRPFFLFLSYYAPHVPMEASADALAGFVGEMPERRRYALAMMSAVDDGVGRVLAAVRGSGRLDNTLVVFLSDNGAPLKLTKPDAPISYRLGAWNGSLNDPLNGEKGMLSEGGIRVPFLLAWPARVPSAKQYSRPVTALDIVPTVLAASAAPPMAGLDGVDLLPLLTSAQAQAEPHDFLAWRFWNQAALRQRDWKLIRVGSEIEMLFDLSVDPAEEHDLSGRFPGKVAELRRVLERWCEQMDPPGVPHGLLNDSEKRWYRHYFGAKTGKVEPLPTIPGTGNSVHSSP